MVTKQLSVISMNILAPSLTREPEDLTTFENRLLRIHRYLTEFTGICDVFVLSEVDEYVDNTHVYIIFSKFFPEYNLYYLPKPQAVIPIAERHGTLVLVNKDTIRVNGVFPVSLTDLSSISSNRSLDPKTILGQNQIILFLLLEHRQTKYPFVLAGVHLKAGNNETIRSIQVKELLKRTHELANEYSNGVAILAGDFNQPNLTLPGYDDVYKCSEKSPMMYIPCDRTQSTAPALKSPDAKDSKHSDTRLDYIFSNVKHVQKRLLTYNLNQAVAYDQDNVSDHFPAGVLFSIDLLPQPYPRRRRVK